MSFIPNPLFAVNQSALQAAQATDQQSRQQPEAPGGNPADQFSNSKVGKDLQTLLQKSQSQQGQQGAPAPGGFQPPSPEYLQTLSIAHNYHAAKQALAQSKLSEMGRQAQTGWMPDPKQMIKLIKQSGMKVDTSPEGIKTAVSYFNQYYGEKDPVSGDSREMPAEIKGMIEKAGNGSLSRKDVSTFVMGAMVKNEMRSARYSELGAQQKAQLEQRSMDAIDKATDMSLPPEDRGKALAQAAILNPQTIGTMAKHMLDFSAATPAERQTQISIASGIASPKEKAERGDALTTQAVQWGMPPALAKQYGTATANGQPLSPEVQAALPKITPEGLELTTHAMVSLANAGVTGDNLVAATKAFQGGGVAAISEFLPKQTPQEIQAQYNKDLLGIEQSKLGVEEGKLGVERGKLQIMQEEEGANIKEREAMATEREAMAKKLGIAPDNEIMKTMMEGIHALSTIKNQTPAMKSLMQELEDTYAIQLGLKPTVKKGWFSSQVVYEQQRGLVDSGNVGDAQTAKPGGSPAEESNSQTDPFVGAALQSLQRGVQNIHPVDPGGGPQINLPSMKDTNLGKALDSIINQDKPQ